MRLASGALAVMVAVARSPAGSPVCHRVTGYDCGPALAEDDKSLVDQRRIRATTRAMLGRPYDMFWLVGRQGVEP